ncbi:MAG: redoxin domain-containing protein [Euryarchaeota archaeon]|nr:redoxin domain-containing protein [Euryarchaeota archaeon]
MEDMIEEVPRMPLIGDDAPKFKAKTTFGEIDFPGDYKGKWVILFSHSADFTPVCTTEFIKCATMQKELNDLNTELIGLSVDSIYSHIAWLRIIKEKIEYKGLKNVEIMFPVIEDLGMEIAKKYGMIHPKASLTREEILEKLQRSEGPIHLDEINTKTVRAVFIIDPKAKIRAILYYPLSNGRNMDEVKRLLIAMQRSDKENIETPENWQPGDDVILATPESYETAKERVETEEEGKHCHDWFMCFRNDPQN